MNHKHLHYMETTAFKSINHNHRSIRAGKLPHIRQTNGPNRIQAASADITATRDYDDIMGFFPDVSACERQLRSESASAADSAASAALPWPITQNHLYSPPLTFHPSFYH